MIKNLREFSLSRQFMTVEDGDKICHCLDGYDDMTHVYVYVDQGFIYSNKDKTMFNLCVERSDYASTDLEELEEILWDWYKFANPQHIPYDDLEEDLHERSRDWLEECNLTCSLLEVPYEFLQLMTDDAKFQHEYLTRQWEELSEYRDRRKPTTDTCRGYCVKCKSDNISYKEIILDAESVGYPYHCIDCNSDGVEWYTMQYDVTTSKD